MLQGQLRLGGGQLAGQLRLDRAPAEAAAGVLAAAAARGAEAERPRQRGPEEGRVGALTDLSEEQLRLVSDRLRQDQLRIAALEDTVRHRDGEAMASARLNWSLQQQLMDREQKLQRLRAQEAAAAPRGPAAGAEGAGSRGEAAPAARRAEAHAPQGGDPMQPRGHQGPGLHAWAARGPGSGQAPFASPQRACAPLHQPGQGARLVDGRVEVVQHPWWRAPRARDSPVTPQATTASSPAQGLDDTETPPKVEFVGSRQGLDPRRSPPSDIASGLPGCSSPGCGGPRQGIPTPQGRALGPDGARLRGPHHALQQLQARIEGGVGRSQPCGRATTRGVTLEAAPEEPAAARRAPGRDGGAPCGHRREAAGLEEFSVTSPFFGAAAAAQSFEGLSRPLQHALGFLRAVGALPVAGAGSQRAFLPAPAAPLADRPTLVLDLDETLVHCHCGPGRGSWAQAPPGSEGGEQHALPAPPTDLLVEFDDVPGRAVGAVAFRPGVRRFLEAAARRFEVVVFTASQQSYADKVIDALDPSGLLVAHRLYRGHCTEYRGAFFKDLGHLGRPLARCVLVDNSPISVALNPDNGILIRSWFGDPGDRELADLLSTLEVYRASGRDADRFFACRYGLRDFFGALRSAVPPRPPAPPGPWPLEAPRP